MSTHKGRTDNVQGVFLGADFWEPGRKIVGKVLRAFESKNGRCYTVKLGKAVEVHDAQEELVAIGALKGFQMALDDCGLSALHAGDTIYLECTGKKDQERGKSPMVEFELEVETADGR